MFQKQYSLDFLLCFSKKFQIKIKHANVSTNTLTNYPNALFGFRADGEDQ